MEFSQIALLLVVAGIFGIIAKALRQPLLIGYLFAGLLLSLLGVVSDTEVFSGLGQIGVTLLLFLVGLEMNMGDLKRIGKVALFTGIGQITFTSVIGFLIATALGFGTLPAVYIAVALTFSSTIIMVNLLSAKNDLNSLYGKISIGFLLVQDVVAVLILMFLAGLGTGGVSAVGYLILAVKATALFVTVWLLSKKILPNMFERLMGGSGELLYIGSIAWALGVAALVDGPLGFTLEIGGFLAGLALSNLPEHLQIASKTRPLRDFFLTIFFILLGTKLVIGDLGGVVVPSIIFSTFVLIGNPLIVLSIMGVLGYKKRTSFLSGLTVAQISEFSLIIMAMGVTLGHVSDSNLSTIVLVGVITMTISTYMVMGADKIYKVVKNYLTIFEKSTTKEAILTKQREFSDHVVLVGGGRTGTALIPFISKKEINPVVVDFDPETFEKLTADRIPVVFGDINDPDTLDLTRLSKARLVVSTISDYGDNLALLEHIKGLHRRPKTIIISSTRKEAIEFYEKGATYVIVPGVVAGEHIRHILKTYGFGGSRIQKMGKGHFKRLVLK